MQNICTGFVGLGIVLMYSTLKIITYQIISVIKTLLYHNFQEV